MPLLYTCMSTDLVICVFDVFLQAAMNGSTEITHWLLETGSDTEIKDGKQFLFIPQQ